MAPCSRLAIRKESQLAPLMAPDWEQAMVRVSDGGWDKVSDGVSDRGSVDRWAGVWGRGSVDQWALVCTDRTDLVGSHTQD
jgi:hypothetical protein